VVLLALSPLAVKFLNVDGAALALDAVMLLGVALAYFYVSRRIHLQFKLIFLPSLVSAVAATLFYLWISNWYNFATLTPLISLVMKGVVVGGVYLAVVLLIEGKKIREDAVYFLRSVRG
jgi:hypothetical protein